MVDACAQAPVAPGLATATGVVAAAITVAGISGVTAPVWVPSGLILGAAAVGAYVDGRNALHPPSIEETELPRADWVAAQGEEWLRPRVGAIWPAVGEQPFASMEYLPELRDHLVQFSCFAKRDYALLVRLRNRAVVWCKEKDLPDSAVARYLPGSVAKAFALSPSEQAALEHLRAPQVAFAIEQSARLVGGQTASGRYATLREWLRGRLSTVELTRNWRLWLHDASVPVPSA